MAADLLEREYYSLLMNLFRKLRRKVFQWEAKEKETQDILDKCLVRAKAKKELGHIDAPTYHIIADKIDSLKKLKFTEDYEKW